MITKERFKKISADLSVQDVHEELDVACEELYTVVRELPNTIQTLETSMEYLKSAIKQANKYRGFESLSLKIDRIDGNLEQRHAQLEHIAEDFDRLYKDLKKLKS